MGKSLSGAMPLIADVTFVKTSKGKQEIRTRQYGLSPRCRQLLLLIDGSRTSVQLLKIFPEPELAAYLAVLETNAFIESADELADLMPGRRSEVRLSALSAAAAASDFGRARATVLVQLLKVVGPAGEPFALRIVRCRDHAELQSLFPAILSVIEVFAGPSKAQQFARETLPL